MFRMVPLLLRLIRTPNLFVVAVTQYLILFHVIQPALIAADVAPTLTFWKFLELTCITIAITASGYVINDIQDERIDEINKPGKNPVTPLGRARALWLYGAVVLCGFLVSQLMAFRLGERDALWLYPVAVGVLAVYSVYLKRQPLAGNIIVAIYCAGVIALVMAAERTALAELSIADPAAYDRVIGVCYLFMAIAILATLLRELVKDLEDIDGDRVGGRKTIPLLWGVRTARWVAVVIGLATAAALLGPIVWGWEIFHEPAVLLWTVALVLAVAVMLVQVMKATTAKDYQLISRELKLFLFGGLVLLLLLSNIS